MKVSLTGSIVTSEPGADVYDVNTGTFGTLTVNQGASIGGDLNVTKNISSLGLTTANFTTGLATFNDNATFGKNIMLNGKLGIGVAAPSELLEVGGNIKGTGLFFRNHSLLEARS